MRKFAFALFAVACSFILSLGSTGCQKSAPPTAKESAAPVVKSGPPAQPPLELQQKTVDLVLDSTKSVETTVSVKHGMIKSVDGGKDGLSAKVQQGTVPGLALKITAAKDAKVGDQELVIHGQGGEKATLLVHVKAPGKTEPAQKEDAKKDNAKKDDAKKDDVKKDEPKKSDTKKDTSYLDERRPIWRRTVMRPPGPVAHDHGRWAIA